MDEQKLQQMRQSLQQLRAGNTQAQPMQATSTQSMQADPQKLQDLRNKLNQRRQTQGTATVAPEQEPKFKDLPKTSGGGVTSNIASGVAKWGIDTLKNSSSLGERFLRGSLKTLLPKSAEEKLGISTPSNQTQTGAEQLIPKSLTAPTSKVEKGTMLGAEIGSYFVPGAASLKAGKLAGAATAGAGRLLSGAAKLGTIGAAEGVLGTGFAGLQSGKVGSRELGIGALSTVVPPVLAGVGAVGKKMFQPLASKVTNAIGEAIDKAIKPTVSGKTTNVLRSKYYEKASEAFRVINDYKPKFIDNGVEVIRNPKTTKEFFESIEQAKNKIFSLYDNLAATAGERGVTFNAKPIVNNLVKVSDDLSYNPQIRQYASQMIREVSELNGQSLQVVQSRLRDLNESLNSFFLGRVDKAKARVDASLAASIKGQLDELIEKSTGASYSTLKKQYGALSTVEKDLARQVAIEARKAVNGLIDFTDIFTGGNILGGIVSLNPGMMVSGVTGRALKALIKYINNPNRYIENAFKLLNKVPARKLPITPAALPKRLALPAPRSIQLGQDATKGILGTPATNQPGLNIAGLLEAPKGKGQGIPIPLKAPGKSMLGVTEINNAAKKKLSSLSLEGDKTSRSVQVAKALYGTGAKVKGKEVDIVLGLPASGKSRVFTDKFLKEKGGMLVDADEAKKILLSLPENKGKTAADVHNISSEIVENDLLRRAAMNGDNMVFPMIGKNQLKVQTIIDYLNAKGYKVNLHLSEISNETSQARAQLRVGQTGQSVPMDVIKGYGNSPTVTFQNIINNPANKGKITAYNSFSNEVPLGQSPEFIKSSQPSVLFVSPNKLVGTKFNEAVKFTNSEGQIKGHTYLQNTINELKVPGTIKDGVGTWSDGAENTLVFESSKMPKDVLKLIGAKSGKKLGQKQILWFSTGEGGDYLHKITTKIDDLGQLNTVLQKNGLSMSTITSDGTVYLVNKKGEYFNPQMFKEISNSLKELDIPRKQWERYVGEAGFEGSFLEGEVARSDAQTIFNKIINKYDKK